jgi:DNA-binding NtrC family response regulator
MKTSVLVVEDDEVLNQLLVMALRKAGYEMSSARFWSDARRQIEMQAPDVVLLDMNLPDAEGLEPLAEIAADRPTVMLTAYGSIDNAVKAMRLGAADYLVKPVNLDELEIVIRRAVDTGRLRAARAMDQAASSVRRTPDLLGESPAMLRLHELIAAVARSEATVLVTGESGTGKELVAHAIHQAGPRSAERFVAVDCCTLQETLFESELFGHERGAFTGADRRKPGLIEAAAGGTLFLDEIGDIGPALQAKLLRVLEDGEFERVGSSRTQSAQVRVISATNADLDTLIGEQRFRQDLLFRLNTVEIHLPPLRERGEDILRLGRRFLARHAQRYRREGLHLSPAAEAVLLRYPWPGNVRELNHVLERAVLMASGKEISVADLHLKSNSAAPAESRAIDAIEGLTLDAAEELMIRQALVRSSGNLSHAADALGLSRAALYRRLEKYSIEASG